MLSRVYLLLLLLGSFVVSGCGTTHALTRNSQGQGVMLLGFDPVAYFREGKPVRGQAAIKATLAGSETANARTYYFASNDNRAAFLANPRNFEPQYGGFCASGAAFGLKLGSDPTAWEIYQGRLFIFGDVLGHEAWKIDRDWNVKYGDEMWPFIAASGWRARTLMGYISKVPWYKNTAQIKAEYAQKNPGKPWPSYDPGGMITNFSKQPGWRAAEGFGQPALGYPE
jgi:YHS domain-containing protein